MWAGEPSRYGKPPKMTPAYFKELKVTGSIAFEVSDIEKLTQKLKKRASKFYRSRSVHEGHCKTVYLEDPDGDIVTLHQLLEND